MRDAAFTQWVITADHVCDGADAGTVGPRRATLLRDDIVGHPEAVEFRLYDDDGELYYEGAMVPGDDGESLFAPLDDFGGPNAGCTRMDTKNKETGKWEPL